MEIKELSRFFKKDDGLPLYEYSSDKNDLNIYFANNTAGAYNNKELGLDLNTIVVYDRSGQYTATYWININDIESIYPLDNPFNGSINHIFYACTFYKENSEGIKRPKDIVIDWKSAGVLISLIKVIFNGKTQDLIRAIDLAHKDDREFGEFDKLLSIMHLYYGY